MPGIRAGMGTILVGESHADRMRQLHIGLVGAAGSCRRGSTGRHGPFLGMGGPTPWPGEAPRHEFRASPGCPGRLSVDHLFGKLYPSTVTWSTTAATSGSDSTLAASSMSATKMPPAGTVTMLAGPTNRSRSVRSLYASTAVS